MRVGATTKPISQVTADVALCFAFEGDKAPRGVDASIAKILRAQMKADGFSGKSGDQLLWSFGEKNGPRRLILLGMGARKKVNAEALRFGVARGARLAIEQGATTLSVALPDVLKDAERFRVAAEGAWLGGYQFQDYLTDPRRKASQLTRIDLSSSTSAPRGALAAAKAASEGVCLARDLVNEPPSTMNPAGFVKRARVAAKKAGLQCKVMRKAQLEKIGMGALLAVARGAASEPHVLHLIYKPKKRPTGKNAGQKVMLIGKGVTFDSGGLNLKPGPFMTTMKCDMGGAAAVLGAMTTLSQVGCGVEVHALIGLVENMTGGNAYKPGDILKTYSGKTVEIGNTDAEGRLVMCDLLAWGSKTLKPTEVVDVATLTGAVVVALGERAIGLFARDDNMSKALLSAASAAGEKMWPMPLYDDYLQLLQKGPADLNNVGGRYGGAITAALYLGEFVPRDIPWSHLDIAGPAFAESDLPEAPAGGTGAGVLSLSRWLEAK